MTLSNPFNFSDDFIAYSLKINGFIFIIASVVLIVYNFFAITKYKKTNIHFLTGRLSGLGKLLITPLLIGFLLFVLSQAIIVDHALFVLFLILLIVFGLLIKVFWSLSNFIAYNEKTIIIIHYPGETEVDKEDFISIKKVFLRYYKVKYIFNSKTRSTTFYSWMPETINPYSNKTPDSIKKFMAMYKIDNVS